MRIVLEVQTGVKRGHRIWLRGRQSLSVGGTEYADFAVLDDPLLSGVHFTLYCHPRGCRVRDLESTHGTYVNARSVVEQWLVDGDSVLAGQTRFLVRIDLADRPCAGSRVSRQRACGV